MQPFNVYQRGRLLFTVHARSLDQARSPLSRHVSPIRSGIRHRSLDCGNDPADQERPSRKGLHLSDAEMYPPQYGA